MTFALRVLGLDHVVVRVRDLDPTEGVFNCDPENVIRIPIPAGAVTTLADVGHSATDLR